MSTRRGSRLFWLRRSRPSSSGLLRPTRCAGATMPAGLFADLPAESLGSGSALAQFIEPTQTVRSDAILKSGGEDHGEGVRYQIEYSLRARASSPVLWIEECGRWFAGDDAKPARAEGVVRIDNERHARDEQLAEAGAARSVDGRTQPYPSGGVARRDAGGCVAIPGFVRLPADRHRSSCPHQRFRSASMSPTR